MAATLSDWYPLNSNATVAPFSIKSTIHYGLPLVNFAIAALVSYCILNVQSFIARKKSLPGPKVGTS